jgi:SAM-dependent methyltransferase
VRLQCHPMEVSLADAHRAEVGSGDRFEFGENWRRFLEVLDEDRVAEAERSLRDMLGTDRLDGVSFLDAGSGSGLFSLAAHRLGASVTSIDFDPSSVGCTLELRRRFGTPQADWRVEHLSVLEEERMAALGSFDIVYSWGVLHHTGRMWEAMDVVARRVAPGGRLFISIYNDQGLRSRVWAVVKRIYNRLPEVLRMPFAAVTMTPRELMSFAYHLLRGRPHEYVRGWTQYKRERGMSRWHDIVDWVGGHPFEVATPDQVFDFLRARGYTLERMKTTRGGLGCNEFVFRLVTPADA